MKIIEKSRELTKIEEYLMTLSNDVISMKDVDEGEIISVNAYMIYSDTNSHGEEVEILSIMDDDKKVYATQSATFKRSFLDMYSMMDGEKFSIVKKTGTTKAGRPYVDCSLDVTNL